jgi:BlaI family penicillinase repressor
MPKSIGSGLSRREREILDILFRKGSATVSEVLAEIPDPITYSAVRSTLRILVEKGHAQHREDGKRYVYMPLQSRAKAAQSALQQVVKTFFGGSLSDAVKAFLDSGQDVPEAELEHMAHLIEEARKESEEKEAS